MLKTLFAIIMVMATGITQLALAHPLPTNTVSCTYHQGRLKSSLTISFSVPINDMGKLQNAVYQYSQIWSGNFPTETYESGPVLGEAYWAPGQKINGEFIFMFYGKEQKLKIENSTGSFGQMSCVAF